MNPIVLLSLGAALLAEALAEDETPAEAAPDRSCWVIGGSIVLGCLILAASILWAWGA